MAATYIKSLANVSKFYYIEALPSVLGVATNDSPFAPTGVVVPSNRFWRRYYGLKIL